jgi:hypothetical protein
LTHHPNFDVSSILNQILSYVIGIIFVRSVWMFFLKNFKIEPNKIACYFNTPNFGKLRYFLRTIVEIISLGN